MNENKTTNQFETAYNAVCKFYENEKSYIYKTSKNPYRKLDNLEVWFSKKVLDLNQSRLDWKLDSLKFSKSLASLKVSENQKSIRGFSEKENFIFDDSNVFWFINTKMSLDACMNMQDQKTLLCDTTKITKQKRYKILTKARKLATARCLAC